MKGASAEECAGLPKVAWVRSRAPIWPIRLRKRIPPNGLSYFSAILRWVRSASFRARSTIYAPRATAYGAYCAYCVRLLRVQIRAQHVPGFTRARRAPPKSRGLGLSDSFLLGRSRTELGGRMLWACGRVKCGRMEQFVLLYGIRADALFAGRTPKAAGHVMGQFGMNVACTRANVVGQWIVSRSGRILL
jgi:hypothetical protein